MLLENINTLEGVAEHMKQQLRIYGHNNYYVVDNEFMAYVDHPFKAEFYWNFDNKKDGHYAVEMILGDTYLYHICNLFITIKPTGVKVHIY